MCIRLGDTNKYWFASGGRFSRGDIIRYDTGPYIPKYMDPPEHIFQHDVE